MRYKAKIVEEQYSESPDDLMQYKELVKIYETGS